MADSFGVLVPICGRGSRRLTLLSAALVASKSTDTPVAPVQEPDQPEKGPTTHSEVLKDVVRAWESLALNPETGGQTNGESTGPSKRAARRREIRSAGCPIPPNLLGRLESTLSQLRWPVCSQA